MHEDVLRIQILGSPMLTFQTFPIVYPDQSAAKVHVGREAAECHRPEIGRGWNNKGWENYEHWKEKWDDGLPLTFWVYVGESFSHTMITALFRDMWM